MFPVWNMAKKQCFLVCPPSGNMARKQCFLVCLPSGNMARKQCTTSPSFEMFEILCLLIFQQYDWGQCQYQEQRLRESRRRRLWMIASYVKINWLRHRQVCINMKKNTQQGLSQSRENIAVSSLYISGARTSVSRSIRKVKPRSSEGRK